MWNNNKIWCSALNRQGEEKPALGKIWSCLCALEPAAVVLGEKHGEGIVIWWTPHRAQPCRRRYNLEQTGLYVNYPPLLLPVLWDLTCLPGDSPRKSEAWGLARRLRWVKRQWKRYYLIKGNASFCTALSYGSSYNCPRNLLLWTPGLEPLLQKHHFIILCTIGKDLCPFPFFAVFSYSVRS